MKDLRNYVLRLTAFVELLATLLAFVSEYPAKVQVLRASLEIDSIREMMKYKYTY